MTATLNCCFMFHTSQQFFPTLHKPDQQPDLSLPVSCMWRLSWTPELLNVKAWFVLSEHQETLCRTSVTVFIVWPQTLSELPFLVPYLYIWVPAPVSVPFFPLVAYCSALQKETAAIATGFINFLQTACHQILEENVVDHSTILYVL